MPTPTPPLFVADDEPNDLLLFQHAVRKSGLGLPVETVTDGEEAVEWLSGIGAVEGRIAPLAVLLDIKMPRRTGFEVLEWARRRPQLRGVPLVVLTSSAQEADVAKAYALGASSYLVKPVAFQDLVALVGALGRYWALNQRVVASLPS